MTNNMYWITNLIFAVVLTIMWMDKRSGVREHTKGGKSFALMLGYGIFFCFQDMVWGLCDSEIIKGDSAFFYSSSIFHFSLVFASCFCMYFFMDYLGELVQYKRIYIATSVAVILVQMILVVSNFIEPILFSIENGDFISGELRPLSFSNQYTIYVLNLIIIFVCVRKANIREKIKYKPLLWVAIIPLITGVFQLYYYEAPFYSLGYFLECMILHMFIISKDKNELTQERILDSISNAYYSMHLFDIEADKMETYIESDIVKSLVKDRSKAQEEIRNVMRASASEEYAEHLLEFVNFQTLSERMKGQNSIAFDFLGNIHGWVRATFIAMDRDADGKLKKVMFMTQIIDEQKKREQELFASSNTDELTQLNNRRAYEEEISKLDGNIDNLVYISIDVNELKVANDNLGHEAGDELLKGAAGCMQQCFGSNGTVYRTGGDEFVVLLFATEAELERIKKDFETTVSEWSGSMVDHLTVSAGYVQKKECEEFSIAKMAQLADERMYQAKSEFYKSKGVDRRGQAAAHKALCNLYTKILKINLTKDTYSIVNMDVAEQTSEKGFTDSISGWLGGFGKSGQVHPDDLEEYLRETDTNYLKDYFNSDKTSISIYYRRKYGDDFKQVAMEMIPADDYSADNQTLFLYVKTIDR